MSSTDQYIRLVRCLVFDLHAVGEQELLWLLSREAAINPVSFWDGVSQVDTLAYGGAFDRLTPDIDWAIVQDAIRDMVDELRIAAVRRGLVCEETRDYPICFGPTDLTRLMRLLNMTRVDSRNDVV